MSSTDTIQLISLLISQAQVCSIPSEVQSIAITALVAATIGVFAVSGGVAITGLATTIVHGIVAGTPIAMIAAAIEADLATTGTSLGLVATIVGMIKNIKDILGC